jgi:hypothetical protein
VFTTRYELDMYIQYRSILTLVLKWYKGQCSRTVRKEKICSYRVSNRCHSGPNSGTLLSFSSYQFKEEELYH